MEPKTLDDTLEYLAKECFFNSKELSALEMIERTVAAIKLALSEHLPDTYDEHGIAKTAQQYLSELEKMLK